MDRLTLTLDEGLVRWAEAEAEREGTDLSGMVQKMLMDRMRAEDVDEENAYEAARLRFFSVRPQRLKEPGDSYPKRAQLHERSPRR